MESFEIVYVSWYLCDRWGSNEESGCSLHKDLTDFEQWHLNYKNKFPNGDMGDIYHIPRKPEAAKVTKEIYDKILSTECGVRLDVEDEEKLAKVGDLFF
jgi:hypothetical protein